MAAVVKAKPFKTWVAKAGEIKQNWYIVDASGLSLGRLAVPIAMRLMGKDKPTYTPHIDTGDFVIVTNAEKISIHPKKVNTKLYRKWSGFPGGLRERTFAEEQAKNPATVIREAVKRMLPKTLLGKQMLRKLKIYAGDKHPHTSQKAAAWTPPSK